MKYAHIDNNNKILGWYDSDIHEAIPQPSIEVSESEWREAISINANFYDGSSFLFKDLRTQEETDRDEVIKQKNFLLSTDWVVVKMMELGNTDELKLKYSDILVKREEARNIINSKA